MPTNVNIPYGNTILNQIRDLNADQRQPVWMAMRQLKNRGAFTPWLRDGILKKVKWEPGSGDYMMTITPTASPVVSQTFVPATLNETRRADMVSMGQETTLSWLYQHEFWTERFHWLPNFRDFDKKTLAPNQNNLDLYQQLRYAQFIRTMFVENCRYVYVMGAEGANRIMEAPYGNPTNNTLNKNLEFWAAACSNVGQGDGGYLTITNIVRALREISDMGVKPVELPKEGEKWNTENFGRYKVIGDKTEFMNWAWDPFLLNFKKLSNDANRGFNEAVREIADWIGEDFPIRFKLSGTNLEVTTPAPEIEELRKNASSDASSGNAYTGPGSQAYTNRNVGKRPNMDYVDSEYGLLEIIGEECGEIIDVGPPPAEFAGKAQVDSNRINSLMWNGKPFVTDKILLTLADGTQRMDVFNEFRQLCSLMIMGYNPVKRFNSVCLLYRRNKSGAATTPIVQY